MNIGLTFNVRHAKPDLNNPQYIKEAEFDTPETINTIVKTLESLGHKVYQIEANEKAYLKLFRLKNKLDLVFNIAEGMHGADREAQIPAMLEMLEIPYSGPKPLGYAVGLNKSVAKEILFSYKIATPEWMTVYKIDYLDKHKFKHFPAIAKPLSEGSSKGITSRNLVKNQKELKKIVNELLIKFKQPVIVEEYLPGREFTVAVLGSPAKILPIIEVTFDKLPKGMPRFDHYEAKWVYDNPESSFDPLVCPAKITPALEKKIEILVLESFKALELHDWARFDVRLDKRGEPNFIEVNCPPGIIPEVKENSRFPRAARTAGMNYAQMLEEILKSACKRYKINYKRGKLKK
jgi:D-alanine-D-alanine ligase